MKACDEALYKLDKLLSCNLYISLRDLEQRHC